MESSNLQFGNHQSHQSSSYFTNCFAPMPTPIATSREDQEAYCRTSSMITATNTVSFQSMSSVSSSDNPNTFLNDALQIFRPNRQPQHQQLKEEQEKRKELDTLLAQSMAELSFKERQEQQEVLHGVASEVAEDEEKIESWSRELDQSLQQRIARSHQGDSKMKAIKYALETNPNYVQNREMRLMFLRGNEYNAEKAADQMIRFFSTKEGLFGRDKLCKEITLEDFDQDDKTAFVSGMLQIVGHDQAGRQIMMEITSLRTECPTLQSELRYRFYMFISVLKNNPMAQIKGVVLIIYGVDKFQDQSGGKGFVENTSLALSLPLQISGVHMCISNPAQYIFSSGALRLAPAKLRTRVKVHFGSHLECQYLLSTYGIPVENLPLMSGTNEARMDYHLQWCRERFLKECGDCTDDAHLPELLWNLPYTLKPTDVLFHRKKSNNGGNQRLRSLTRHLLQSYNEGNKRAKRELVDYMMKDIANNGGRFLKQANSEQPADANNIVWTVVTESEVREKISQMFRNHRRPNVQQQQELQQQQQQDAALSGVENGNETNPHRPSPLTLPSHTMSQYPANFHDPPNDADVLFGRKRNNAGNKLVRKMVAELSNEYEAANRTRKLEITNAIVDQVHALGGRFLRKTDQDRWEEVGTDFARAKISKHFRNHRRPAKPKASTTIQPTAAASNHHHHISIMGASRNSGRERTTMGFIPM